MEIETVLQEDKAGLPASYADAGRKRFSVWRGSVVDVLRRQVAYATVVDARRPAAGLLQFREALRLPPAGNRRSSH